MESCPDNVKLAEILVSIRDQEYVTNVEHLHIYSTSFDRVVLMANILISTCEIEHLHEPPRNLNLSSRKLSSDEDRFSCTEQGYADKAARAGQKVSNMIMLKFPQITNVLIEARSKKVKHKFY